MAAAIKALEIIEREPERRKNLWENARFMKREFETLGFDTGLSESPVIPLLVGEDVEAFRDDHEAPGTGRICKPGDFSGGSEGSVR